MDERIVDRLLQTLDVAIDAFAVCEVAHGAKLVGPGIPEIEVHYILSGRMVLDVPGAARIECGPGSIVLVPPNMHQTIGADSRSGVQVSAADHNAPLPSGLIRFDATRSGSADLRFVCGLITANISGTFGLLDTVRKPLVEDLATVPFVRGGYELILAELNAPGMASRAIMSAVMKACLLLMLRRHFGRAGHESGLLGSLRGPRLGKAVTAVLDKPAAHHSVAALASIAGMSRSAFAREFSNAFAMSPMAFVARTRLNQAAEMLRSTNTPVKVIAAAIGFSSRSHFSRAFRDVYGLDPSAYRRQQVGESEVVPRLPLAKSAASLVH